MRVNFTSWKYFAILFVPAIFAARPFSDPAVGANVTFTSCTAGTLLASSTTGQASYTFPSGGCDGYGFTAVCNATGTSATGICRVLISAIAGVNILRFDRSGATGISVTVTNAQLSSTSGARFKLTNLQVYPVNGGSQTLTVTAYASGVAVPGSTITINYASTTPIHGTTLTSTDFGANYNNIDAIQISTNLVYGVSINDIQTSPAVSLPVTLESFTGSQQGNAVVLNWTTAQEINNAWFDIERKGGDSAWSDIGKVNGHGTTVLPESYSFTDNTPLSGVDCYRLKQVDLDGNFVYSPIVTVEQPATALTLNIFPNPVQESLHIAFTHTRQETATITITDLSGATVRSSAETITQGINNLTINGLQALAQGTYIVHLVTPTTQYSSKFFKGK